MRELDWLYYKSEKDRGNISLENLLQGIASARFDFDTYIKPSRGLYWCQIRENQEILYQLPWYYNIDNVIHEVPSGEEIVSLYQQGIIQENTCVRLVENEVWKKLKDTFLILEVLYHLPWCYIADSNFHEVASGEEIISLYRQGVIHANTYVKLTRNEDWKKLRNTYLWKKGFCEGFSHNFYGYSSLPPQKKVMVGEMIDAILACSFSVFLVCLFFFGIKRFQGLDLVIFSQVPFVVGTILPKTFQAIFLHLFGSTLGLRLVGIYILTAKQEKLPFSTAFKREFSWLFIYKKQPNCYKRFGTTEWDLKNSIIFSNESPKIDSFATQEN